MEDNKRDYSDFFKADHKENESREKEERPSYYYSYGPYKRPSQEEEAPHETSTTFASAEGISSVEVSTPRPVRSYGYGPYGQEAQSQVPAAVGGWKLPEPKKQRSTARSMFAAFMAGAVLVGSLMFASDRMNLFSGDRAAGAGSGGNGSVPAAGSSGTSAGLKSAALDMSRPGNISSIVEQSSPAVVKIEAYVKQKARTRSNSLLDDPFFRYFFGDEQPRQQQQQPKSESKVQSGMGTGFIFEKSGYILTNQHVVDGAEEIQVIVQGYDKPFTAKLLGNSFDLDLAVLKIEHDKDLPILPIGDSKQMKVGDWVVAIGNPYGFDHTVTVGVVSAGEREISIPDTQGTRNYKHLLQTDASINPGNSGGPLLNLNGEVIGINTAVNAQAQGIGFAIPTSTISEVLDKLKNNVQIPKEPIPFIGATLESLKNVETSWLKELKIEGTDGALVEDVIFGTPAFRSGLKKYDVIKSIDGTAIKTREELIAKIQAKKVGDKAVFGIIRDGAKMDLEIPVGDRNEFNQKQQKQQ